ncbi:MAG: IS1595 family transposase [Oligoflexia bacterium]|nr:IS1595 family transposase [Oligoflexia bacterium]
MLQKERLSKLFEKTRWPNGVACQHCGSKRISEKANRMGVYRCKDCRKEFSVQTGTVFEQSPIPLRKWLYAIYLLQTDRKGVSSLQLSKQIGVTQKTAWHMLHRLKKACESKGGLLSGVVSSDEAYFLV